MLVIKEKSKSGVVFEYVWHVGEPLPELSGRVITFQADGDELDTLLGALKKYSKADLDYCYDCGGVI